MRDDLVVRPWCADDAGALAALYALDRDEIEASEPWRVPSYFTAVGQLDRIARVWAEHRALGFVAVDGEDVVGSLALEDVTDHSASVGYYIVSTRRREGLATRGLATLVGIAFDDVGLRALRAEIHPDNHGSLVVAERNGFHFVDTVIIDGIELRRLMRSG